MQADLNIQTVSSLDRGLSYAESCFETFRVIDGAIFAWDKHWQRLSTGLRSFGIDISSQQKHIYQACLQAATDIHPDCLLRLTVTGGNAPWGLQQQAIPNIYIQAMPFEKNPLPVRLQCVEYPFPLQDKIAKFSADYALTLRAMQQWQLEKPQLPLLCKDGVLLSGITANIALLVDGMWLTPKGRGILSGCIRQYLIEQGILLATVCPTTHLAQAQAAVLLASGSFIQVVEGIDGRLLDGSHPAIHDLRQAFISQQGVKL